MITFVCVLKSGGDFKAEYVDRLERMIDQYYGDHYEFVCLGDVGIEVPGARRISLKNNLPGWWSKLEMFRVPGPAIYLDLDTDIIGTLGPLVNATLKLKENEIIMVRPWNPRTLRDGAMGSQVVCWNTDLSQISNEVDEHKQRGEIKLQHGRILHYHTRTFVDDQRWISAALKRHKIKPVAIQDVLPGFAHSYKRDLNRGAIPATGSIVIFHGNPRPWNVVSYPIEKDDEDTRGDSSL